MESYPGQNQMLYPASMLHLEAEARPDRIRAAGCASLTLGRLPKYNHCTCVVYRGLLGTLALIVPSLGNWLSALWLQYHSRFSATHTSPLWKAKNLIVADKDAMSMPCWKKAVASWDSSSSEQTDCTGLAFEASHIR